jgi:predicted CopG family antitoxin
MGKKVAEITKKNVAIKPFVYDRLIGLKHGNDTFSDVIERLINNQRQPPPSTTD